MLLDRIDFIVSLILKPCLNFFPLFSNIPLCSSNILHHNSESQLCYYIYRTFEISRDDEKEGSKIFSVPDFVGDACKAIASRIRGAVAGVQFDDFHKVKC